MVEKNWQELQREKEKDRKVLNWSTDDSKLPSPSDKDRSFINESSYMYDESETAKNQAKLHHQVFRTQDGHANSQNLSINMQPPTQQTQLEESDSQDSYYRQKKSLEVITERQSEFSNSQNTSARPGSQRSRHQRSNQKQQRSSQKKQRNAPDLAVQVQQPPLMRKNSKPLELLEELKQTNIASDVKQNDQNLDLPEESSLPSKPTLLRSNSCVYIKDSSTQDESDMVLPPALPILYAEASASDEQSRGTQLVIDPSQLNNLTKQLSNGDSIYVGSAVFQQLQRLFMRA